MSKPDTTSPGALQYVRSSLFSAVFFLSVPVYAVIGLFTFPLPYRMRNAVVMLWVHHTLWWLEVICNLRYEADGLENLPDHACIVMSNHQSTWETLALNKLLPPLVWVVKRELMYVPFFGWALALLEPIALNRGTGRDAITQFLKQGREKLQKGRWILVFPEGTRVPPGEIRRFKLGGAIVASETGTPVIPVAHNAGYFWRRRGFLKLSGTVRISIGPPIETRDKKPEQVAAEAQEWIKQKFESF